MYFKSNNKLKDLPYDIHIKFNGIQANASVMNYLKVIVGYGYLRVRKKFQYV